MSFGEALELNPQDAKLWISHALVLELLNRNEEATFSLGKALELDIQDINVFGMHATSLALLNRDEEALVSIDRALALDPQHSRMLWLRGIVLVRLRRSEDALVSFDKCLTLEPRDADCHTLRSLTLVRLHRSQEARESMKLLIRGENPLDLRSSVVGAIDYFGSEDAEDWLNLWIELWNGDVSYEAPLRLLRVAAEYHKKQDKTVLLSLPAEERKILLPLLKLQEEDLLHM